MAEDFYIHTMSSHGIQEFSVCCHGNNFTTATKAFKSSASLYCIAQSKNSLKAVMILELFRIML